MTTETLDATMTVVDPVATDRAELSGTHVLVSYSRTEAALAELRARHRGAKFDLQTALGNAAARAARMELVTLRTTLEKTRKAFKAPALEFGKKIDDEARRITAEIEALEAPIDAQIKADEARREAIRAEAARVAAEAAAAAERAEAERRQRLEDGITTIAAYVTKAHGKNAADLAKGIAFVQKIVIDSAHWGEYAGRAAATLATTIETLSAMHADAARREDEAARLAAQRIEQERVAAEQARVAAEQAEAQRKIHEEAVELQRRRRAIEIADELQAQTQAAAAIAAAQAVAPAAVAAKIDDEAVPTPEVTSHPMTASEATDFGALDPLAPAVSAEPPDPDEPATIRLGLICQQLGFDITGSFVHVKLGIKGERAGAATLYTESQRTAILRSLIARIQGLLT